MTALTQAKNVPQKVGDVMEFPVAAATACYQGGLAALDGGYAKPGATATGLIAVGRFEETVINSGTAGEAVARVRIGIFRFENSAAADEITQAEVGQTCYIVDDQTVGKTATGRSVAGVVISVDAAEDGGGVWVRLGI